MLQFHRIGSIWAVGRNYKDHAAEMNAPIPTQPLIFLKSGGTVLPPKSVTRSKSAALSTKTRGPKTSKPANAKGTIKLVPIMGSIHHELEIMLFLGKDLQVEYYGLALDLTARDIQAEAKKKGEPWTLSKSFKNACPVGPILPFKSWKEFQKLQFELQINGVTRQKGKTLDMIFDGPTLIKHLRGHFPVRPYDAILTGTPQGVGPLLPGDLVLAKITEPVPVDWTLKIS